MLIFFTSTYITGFLTSWTSDPSLPPSRRSSIIISSVYLFLGFSIYLRTGTKSDRPINRPTQRIFPHISFTLNAILLALFTGQIILNLVPQSAVYIHPIDSLLKEADKRHNTWRSQASQSKSLNEATVEYHRRYKRQPPPNFDKWHQFATARSSLVIDDYDSIYEDLRPFWALDPCTIRERTREIMSGSWNEVAELLVRSGKAEIGSGVPPTHRWMVEGVVKMMDNFIEHLPDMDLAFNINDEPRVALPYAQLQSYRNIEAATERLESRAHNAWSNDRSETWAADNARRSSRWSKNRSSRNSFNDYGSIACAPTSLARKWHLWDTRALCTSCFSPHSDGLFLQNWTLAASPCHQPDLAYLHGFYLSPAAFKTFRELVPIFSQSKAHGFADILYPSPWNYMDKVKYQPSNLTSTDLPFTEKQNTLFWRGASSEGNALHGTWKGMTRQRFVHLTNNHTSTVLVFLPEPNDSLTYEYQYLTPQTLTTSYLNNLAVNTSFVDKISRCEDDCVAEKAEFGIASEVPFQDHWNYRYLMDMDGAGFSGRFIPFLQSHSLPFKSSLLREWYDSRITAWQHFVPIDIRLHGLWSTLAYFAGDRPAGSRVRDGQRKGERRLVEGEQIAEAGRAWADTVLRKDDMEIYFFRLLLEWGRLTDDRRDDIGFQL